jgi:hypothetical protein
MQIFHASQPWPRITQLARAAGKAYIAVPFIGQGSEKLLPIARDSVLVTRFDKNTLRQGGVCPGTVEQFIGSGVRVYQNNDLHAKVFAFAKRAVVGSANCSLHSAKDLVEACLETDDPTVIRSAKKFVLELAKNELTTDYVKAMAKYYRPPRFPGLAPAEPSTDPKVWVVPLCYGKLTKAQQTATDQAEEAAEQLIHKKSRFGPDSCIIRLKGKHRISTGDEVLQLIDTEEDSEPEVHSLGRVLDVFPVKGKEDREAVVSLERKKGLPFKRKSVFEKRIGRPVTDWVTLSTPKELVDPVLIRTIRSVW